MACIAVTMLLTTVCGCGGTSAGQTDKAAVAKAESRPAFSADSAYRYVEAQVEFGPRVPGSEAHAQCRDFLTAFFRSHGAAVTVQEGATLEEAKRLMHENRLERVLVVDRDFNLSGLITVKDIVKAFEKEEQKKQEKAEGRKVIHRQRSARS